jgi:hypothetical protein
MAGGGWRVAGGGWRGEGNEKDAILLGFVGSAGQWGLSDLGGLLEGVGGGEHGGLV